MDAATAVFYHIQNSEWSAAYNVARRWVLSRHLTYMNDMQRAHQVYTWNTYLWRDVAVREWLTAMTASADDDTLSSSFQLGFFATRVPIENVPKAPWRYLRNTESRPSLFRVVFEPSSVGREQARLSRMVFAAQTASMQEGYCLQRRLIPADLPWWYLYGAVQREEALRNVMNERQAWGLSHVSHAFLDLVAHDPLLRELDEDHHNIHDLDLALLRRKWRITDADIGSVELDKATTRASTTTAPWKDHTSCPVQGYKLDAAKYSSLNWLTQPPK